MKTQRFFMKCLLLNSVSPPPSSLPPRLSRKPTKALIPCSCVHESLDFVNCFIKKKKIIIGEIFGWNFPIPKI
jgi:hypothetical protein